MASFRSKFQISSLLTSNNKYNLFLRQQPWHCFTPVLCSKKNINKEHNCKKVISTTTSDPKSQCKSVPKKMRFLSPRRMPSMKMKDTPSVICKAQKSPKQKLTLWEYVFGPDRKKSQVDCTCRLAHCQRQADRVKDPRLRDSRYRKTAGDVLLYTESVGSLKVLKKVEPQPKPPPAYKMPKAVLLNKMMTGDFKKSENYEDEIVTAPVKSCKEIKPLIDEKITKPQDVTLKNINEKSISRPVSFRKNAVRNSTVKILHQAMAQEEPRRLSRIEKLKTLVNEKMFKS